MSTTVETAAEIRPFEVGMAEQDLVDWQQPGRLTSDLRARVRSPR